MSAKTSNINLRVSDQFQKDIKQRALALGISPSTYLRTCVAYEIKKSLFDKNLSTAIKTAQSYNLAQKS